MLPSTLRRKNCMLMSDISSSFHVTDAFSLHSHARSWRWHKKLQVWLTKDEHMMPQQINPTVERGFYIVWDPVRFQRDRVSLGHFNQTSVWESVY